MVITFSSKLCVSMESAWASLPRETDTTWWPVMSNVVSHSAAATTSLLHTTIFTICAKKARKKARMICGTSDGMTVFLKTKISLKNPVQCVLSSFGSMPGSTIMASSFSSSSSSLLTPTSSPSLSCGVPATEESSAPRLDAEALRCRSDAAAVLSGPDTEAEEDARRRFLRIAGGGEAGGEAAMAATSACVPTCVPAAT
jgi:hypothetical protein